MKHIFIILFAIFSLSACVGGKSKNIQSSETDKVINGIELQVYIIDSCEYIGILKSGYNVSALTHKGNCKFCEQRHKKN